LTGVTRPTSGRALVAGFDVVKEAREISGGSGGFPEIIVDDELTALENLEIQACSRRV
jgi:ABC-2 type transport system ATP-binding protein